MLLLAVDTSGKHGSLALARCPPGHGFEVIEVVPLAGGTFSAQLVPQVATLLSQHGFTKQDIGAFAVASGPGSFTGLRVGLAAIKALAEILHKPIAAVSLLEAVARSGKAQGRVLAVLDAGRGEVYAGEYEVDGAGARRLQERLLTSEEFLTTATGLTVITPDKRLLDMALGANLRVEQVSDPRSDVVARLGWGKIEAGETVSPEQLEANYIRRSDAEIFAKTGN
jgi:tRNA threonylcarbamoyladenosine biosynthesis protein TsaB